MRRKLGLSWMLPLSIIILTIGVISAIAWLASRLGDAEPGVEDEVATVRSCHATVRSITDTKTTHDGENLYQFELSVQPSDGSPARDMTLRDGLTSDEAERAHPGSKFPCLTDWDEPQRVEVIWTQ
jgi:hypothetical protein